MGRVCLLSLCAILATLPLSAQEPKLGRKAALLVGINDYGNTKLVSLRCAERDATDLREVLVAKLGYDKRDVYLMTKAEGFKKEDDSLFPTGKNIRTNLKGLVEDLRKEDTVLILFSGHGVHLKALKEKGLHFCPSDTDLDKPETLVSISEIYAQLKDHCKADLKLLIMDACRNDPSDGRSASDTKLESVTRPLIPKPEGGTVAFFSCSEGQKAYENEKVGRGFFTDSLIRGLSGDAADKDGEITIPLLENFLKKDVPTAVKREKGFTLRQIPERLGDLRGLGLLTKVAVGTTPVPMGKTAPKSLTEAKEPKAGDEREFEIFKNVKMKFCWIPAGEAQLGSPKEEQDNITKAHYKGERPSWLDKETETARGKFKTKGFWLGKYEVTQEQWEAVMGNNPSNFKGAKLPVEKVSWEDCKNFIEKCKIAGLMMKLPHEDEWEYACRGGLGNSQAFYWGNMLNGDKANCDGNFPAGTTTKGDYVEKTTEVGKYEKVALHPWGLCDMAGNVSEWCGNLYTTTDSKRVVRGGSWLDNSGDCRSALRGKFDPALSNFNLGLRLALVP